MIMVGCSWMYEEFSLKYIFFDIYYFGFLFSFRIELMNGGICYFSLKVKEQDFLKYVSYFY